MSNLVFYFQMGWDHIMDWDAIDHQLFILALITGFYIRDVKKLLILATAFTIGHSLTLALSTLKLIHFPGQWAELMISATILFTAFENLFITLKRFSSPLTWKYSSAFVFGLVHGLGFASNLSLILGKEQSLFFPLLGFNLGLEAGQIIIIVLYLFIFGTVATKWRRVLEIAISGLLIIPSFKFLLDRLLDLGL